MFSGSSINIMSLSLKYKIQIFKNLNTSIKLDLSDAHSPTITLNLLNLKLIFSKLLKFLISIFEKKHLLTTLLILLNF